MIFDGLATGLSSVTASSATTGASPTSASARARTAGEVRDQRVTMRHRPAHGRNRIERGRHVADLRTLNQAKPIIVKSA